MCSKEAKRTDFSNLTKPYHVRAQKLKSQKNDGSNPRLTYENIERVLKPFQTIMERNASELSGPDEPIWVQSCYDADLDHRYSELAYWAGAGGDFGPVPYEMMMDDPSRYNFDDDVEKLRQQLLERMPGLCDRRRLHYRETDARAVRDDPERMESKDMRMATYVLFADREAIEGEFVKAMWLDDHGKILMITKMAPAEIESMATMFGEGFSMSEALETYGLNDPSYVRRTSSTEDHGRGWDRKAKITVSDSKQDMKPEERRQLRLCGMSITTRGTLMGSPRNNIVRTSFLSYHYLLATSWALFRTEVHLVPDMNYPANRSSSVSASAGFGAPSVRRPSKVPRRTQRAPTRKPCGDPETSNADSLKYPPA